MLVYIDKCITCCKRTVCVTGFLLRRQMCSHTSSSEDLSPLLEGGGRIMLLCKEFIMTAGHNNILMQL